MNRNYFQDGSLFLGWAQKQIVIQPENDYNYIQNLTGSFHGNEVT